MKEIFSTKIAKVVGTPGQEIWAQTFSSVFLQAVVSLKGKAQIETGEAGKEALNILEEEYASYQEKGRLERLEEAVAVTSQKLREKTEDFQLVVASLDENVLYLAKTGEGVAFLKRGEKLVPVLAKEDKSASGFLKDRDILILATPKFLEIISRQTLKTLLNHHPPGEIAEALAPLIASQEENAGVAAIILSFQKGEEELTGVTPIKERPSLVWQVGERIRERLERLKIGRGRRDEEERSRRTILSVALFLIILLSVSLVLGIGRKKEAERFEEKNAAFTLAQHRYEEGKNLLDLNPSLARTILGEAKKEIEKETVGGKRKDKKIEELLTKINEALESASKVYKLEEGPVFFDLNLIKEGGEGTNLAFSSGKIAVLDSKGKTVYLISETKSGEIVAGGEILEEAKLVGIHGQRVYVLAKEGIIQIEGKEKKKELKIKKDDDWGEIVDLTAFGGNLYLLDKGKNQIWKYIGTETGFSAKTNYLNQDVTPDFSQAKSLAIDGSIWVLVNGKIVKFTQGRADNFLLAEDLEFNNPVSIWTDEKSKNLYILDSGNNRVVVLDKITGAYQAQYQWEGIKEAKDLVVSEVGKKIFLLSGSKITAVEIK